ncbi:MAG: class I SAM-dependent methyltransferase [Candidatus Pacebacteria bacterium]|nr:class I SAM-dependent methyltransferase [Candidatus Paceibacterota bacterium]
MSIKYQNPNFNPDLLSKHNIDRMAIEEIANNSFVLDIGCATGFMGKYLKEKKGCKVAGLDLREDELKIAKKNLDYTFKANIEDESSVKLILNKTKNKFDVILSTSLIEHTAQPDLVIKNMKKLVKPNGKIIMSTPNIAHWTTRLEILKGNFNYTDYGIMDETHLHFFTQKNFRELFVKNNLTIVKQRIDAEGGGLPRLSLALAPFFPNLFAYQILLVAKK